MNSDSPSWWRIGRRRRPPRRRSRFPHRRCCRRRRCSFPRLRSRSLRCSSRCWFRRRHCCRHRPTLARRCSQFPHRPRRRSRWQESRQRSAMRFSSFVPFEALHPIRCWLDKSEQCADRRGGPSRRGFHVRRALVGGSSSGFRSPLRYALRSRVHRPCAGCALSLRLASPSRRRPSYVIEPPMPTREPSVAVKNGSAWISANVAPARNRRCLSSTTKAGSPHK